MPTHSQTSVAESVRMDAEPKSVEQMSPERFGEVENRLMPR